MELWLIWLIIVLFLIFIEINTVNLVSIWFIISGIVSLIISLFYQNFYLQFAIFVILGLILLLTTKQILEKYLKPPNIKTNFDRVVGMTAVVTEPITKNTIGEVKVDGKKWSAISNKPCKTEEEVIVDAIDGVKLIVRKKEI